MLYVYTQAAWGTVGGKKKREYEEYTAEEWVKVKAVGKFGDILLWEETEDDFIRFSDFYRSSF
jgi:hypothetical protein